MPEEDDAPTMGMSADAPRFESVQASYGLLERYFGDPESRTGLRSDIQERIQGELRENRIGSDLPRESYLPKRFVLPWILLPLLLAIVFLSLYVTSRLFSDSLPGLERTALEYGSTEGYILDILRRESEKKLDQSDLTVSRYLGELDDLEARRVLLVSEFAFSLVHRAEELDTEYAARLEEERSVLGGKYGTDSAAFLEAFAARRAELLRERVVTYDRFRRIRMTLFEKEQGEILKQRQDLEGEVTRELLSESAGGTAGIGSSAADPLGIPPAEVPRPLFALPPDLKRLLEQGQREEAVTAVEDILTEIYPDNAEYRAVLKVARLAAEDAAARAAAEAETATDQAVRSEIGVRISAFLAALEREPLLTDRRIEELSAIHGDGDPTISGTLASIARALRTAGANAPETALTFLGTVAIHAEDRIVIELTGKAPPKSGDLVVVRRRTPDGGELPVAKGRIVDVFGTSAEARIEELYDDRISPSLMDRVYLINSR